MLGPMIAEVMRTGVANWTPALPLLLVRSGYPEESYFSVSHAPVEDDAGDIVGMLAVCSEVTQQVLSERRTRLLRDLALKAGETLEVEQTYREVAAAIAEHPLDVPFALLYLREADGRTLALRGSVGIDEDGSASRLSVDAGTGVEAVWPLARAASGETIVVEEIERHLQLRGGFWNDPVRSALAMPIASAAGAAPLGVLIAGVSPNRALDEGYRSFYELLAGQVSVAVRNARTYEEEKRRAEALAELDRAKTAFFSNVSHEFRTPLTLMLGPLEDVLTNWRASLPGDVQEELDAVQRNALRLLRLVNTLLDFSRIEAGRVQAVYEPTDLSTFTAELTSNFSSAADKAGLRLVIDTPALPERVYVDREMWEKIVLNLLSNAFKHTFQGEVAVLLRPVNVGVELEVRDTGTGIPPEELPHLFERFHRVRGARSRTHEGTGIGLALVQELVKLHGGVIGVRSREGEGSTFTVSIPTGTAHLPNERIGATREMASTATRAAAYVEEAAQWFSGADAASAPEARVDMPSEPGEEEEPREPAVRILLVDDNADMRRYVARLLGTRWTVETAAEGAAALAVIRKHPPDLVLTDVMMPGMNGFELLRALRADPETRALPVILLSARAGEESTLEGLEAGADDYLVKPFSARELLTRVRTHLEMARVRHGAEEKERLLQAAEEANRAKSDFLATMSHELRTPLNAIIGYVDLLELGIAGPVTKGQKAQLGRVRASGRHLLGLIDDILDLAKVEAGRMDVEHERALAVNAIAAALALIRPQAAERGIEIQDPCADDAGTLFVGDEDRVRQILANLLSNAVKFTDPGGEIRITCGTTGKRGPEVKICEKGSWAYIRVEDTGVGIGPKEVENIFRPFTQVERGPTRTRGGTGLGLTISRHLARLMDGDLTVESEPGVGSTFTLWLPSEGALEPALEEAVL